MPEINQNDPGAIPPMTDAQRADMELHALAAEATLVRQLGPGETPKRAPDSFHEDGTRRHGAYIGSPSLEDAEAFGNPILPYDSSGHKVHPADAFTHPTWADVEQARGFGGTGAALEPGKDYRVVERIDPISGELVRTKLGHGGVVLDEQREPGPGRGGPHMQQGVSHTEQTMRPQSRYGDGTNGPVL